MDTIELAAIQARAKKAQAVVKALCDREVRWTTSIPARPDSDPDLVISDSLKDVGLLVGEVERLTKELGEALFQVVRLRTAIQIIEELNTAQ